jgi:hypothetical protein
MRASNHTFILSVKIIFRGPGSNLHNAARRKSMRTQLCWAAVRGTKLPVQSENLVST